LIPESWFPELVNDPDAPFLIDGITNGFKIIDPEAPLKSAETSNYRSATGPETRDLVEAAILSELEQGHYRVVDQKPTIISALGAVHKDNGDIRLIHDCSRPRGGAVNDYISDLKVKYQTFNDALAVLQPQSYMAKIDLKSAYRSVKTHPTSHTAAGLKWTFKGHKDPTYMVDTRLPFGSKVAPGVFHRHLCIGRDYYGGLQVTPPGLPGLL